MVGLFRRRHRLHDALKRMLIHPGKLQYRLDARGSDIPRINTHYSAAFVMDLQHDARGLFEGFSEYMLNDYDHEIHRRIVVVEQYHLIHGGRRELGGLALRDCVVCPFYLSAHDNTSVSDS